MITIEEGEKEFLPYVKVEITTGRWPFQYWFEVIYWTNATETECGHWTHYWQKDGGGFGLWFVVRKASVVLQEVWYELVDEQVK